MSSHISCTYFRTFPRNNPLSIVMGARIIHSGMLDKLYVETANWPYATFLIIRWFGSYCGLRRKKSWRVRTAASWEERDMIQWLTSRTWLLWPAEGSRTRLLEQVAPVTLWLLMWTSVLQEIRATKVALEKVQLKWERRFGEGDFLPIDDILSLTSIHWPASWKIRLIFQSLLIPRGTGRKAI